ncbi:HlyD family secretion protein [Mesorhizobium shonense]|uniref:Membrane fusion protein (MFP) family protein n=1 Tax=Mesorhizobium shonense TaxID=1209948 RepID=A0ABV2I3Y7_9HYPH
MSEIDTKADASRSIRRNLLTALFLSVAVLGGAGAWASVTNLSGAVVASGHFVVDSYIKKVQHPTGGVVKEILVREGNRVKTGDVIMRLDATQPRANLAIIIKRLDELASRLARLEAERDDLAEIVLPEWLLKRRDISSAASAILGERKLFEFRRQSREGKKSQLAERIAQYKHEIEGLKAQQIAFEKGIDILGHEIAVLSKLREQGIVSDQRLNSLKSQAATLSGQRGETVANQAQTAGRIAETRLQILQIDQDFKTEVGKELAQVQAQVEEFLERKVAAEDELRRTDIVAPHSGIIQQVAVHTVGGVIRPADPIMLIVPDGDDLLLEVQISPKDIDQIRLGQRAVLRMSAFNLRTTPELNGYVSWIAADLMTNEKNGTSYYLVRLSVPRFELTKIKDLTLIPGMPAEAMIQAGQRTALSYFLKPLSDQINRAFREE